jgi:transcriptional regulator PpsR
MLVSVSSDVALVLDECGVITNVVLGGGEPMTATAEDWVGRAWIDTVTSETKQKVKELLNDVAATGVSRMRQLNHPSSLGLDIPIAYTAVRLGKRGPMLAVGRDMRAVAAMQQRLIQTQQEMERNYWQTRQAETRYRLLFQIATDAVLVVDATSHSIIDANRAASRMFGVSMEDLHQQPATSGIAAESKAEVDGLLSAARISGRPSELKARLSGAGGRFVRISATPYSSEGATVLLMRIREIAEQSDAKADSARLLALAERTPDAIVITDDGGKVVTSNLAFRNLLQLPAEELVKGRNLSDWLCGAEQNLGAILSGVKSNGIAGIFAATLQTEGGRSVHVEISTALLPAGDGQCFGFILRTSLVGAGKGGSDTASSGGRVH